MFNDGEAMSLLLARNALGMDARGDQSGCHAEDRELARLCLAGTACLSDPGLLARLRRAALAKLDADVPKYPALAVARTQWTGEE